MSSQRNHVISCRVTEKLRLSLWTLWLFELAPVQLFEQLTVTMRSSRWVWWRAWPPKQQLSCEIKGNGEKDFLWFSISFVQNYLCGSPKVAFFNPKPSLASERRRGEEEVEEDTSIPVSNNHSWKTLSISRKYLCAFFQIFLHPHISLSAQKHVTFTMGGNLMGIASKYNGNCLRMKNLELPDCHSATPYILPTSKRFVAKISNFLHFLAFDAKIV